MSRESDIFFNALIKTALPVYASPAIHARSIVGSKGPLKLPDRAAMSSTLLKTRKNRLSFLSTHADNPRSHGPAYVANKVKRNTYNISHGEPWESGITKYKAPLFGHSLNRSKLTKGIINTKRAVKSALGLHIGDTD